MTDLAHKLVQRSLPDFVGPEYRRAPEDVPPAADTPQYIFPVLIWRDGGTTDGTKTTQCDRTYKARTLDATGPGTGGVLLGSGLTPVKVRPTTGTLVTPSDTGAGVIGLAYYDADGDFALYDANEALDTDACT